MKIRSTILALTALLGLSACASAPMIDGAELSLPQMLAENRDKPYECVNYNAETDRCKALSTYTSRGFGVFDIRAQSLFPPTGGVVLGRARFATEGTLACANYANYNATAVSGDISPDGEARLERAVEFLQGIGEFCISFQRDGDGYTANYVRGNRYVMSLRPERIDFFAEPKELYLQ